MSDADNDDKAALIRRCKTLTPAEVRQLELGPRTEKGDALLAVWRKGQIDERGVWLAPGDAGWAAMTDDEITDAYDMTKGDYIEENAKLRELAGHLYLGSQEWDRIDELWRELGLDGEG